MAVLYFACAALLFATTQAQCLPFTTPIPQVVSPCQQPVVASSPVVATTVVDNSVSNALANALQLLIVSNLIENTMTSPCGCGLNALNSPCGCGLNTLPAVATPICDAIPIPTSVYSPAIDVIAPSYIPYDPIPVVSPCDIISPCDPVIDIIPNGCYPDILPVSNVGCGCGCGCNCDGPFNFGSNFGSSFGSNFGPNFGSNFGCNSCGCGNCFGGLSNILPNLLSNIGMPGCGCRNFGYDVNPFGPMFGCDQCGPDMFPAIPAQVSCSYGYGVPNLPIAVSVDPFGYDSCPNKCYGNGYYY